MCFLQGVNSFIVQVSIEKTTKTAHSASLTNIAKVEKKVNNFFIFLLTIYSQFLPTFSAYLCRKTLYIVNKRLILAVLIEILKCIIYNKYRNTGARHRHESETKSNMKNVRSVDNLVKRMTGLSNSTMDGANNTRVSGTVRNSSIMNDVINKIAD